MSTNFLQGDPMLHRLGRLAAALAPPRVPA
ncbi:hypothetical protein SAMN04489832_5502 [Micromonospora cremea]|uniref:Uncharacterized protein n=1 Tax=Micromonospora cremea TaxID=709881 RepID=A0A1N6AGS7_9ACTN|nr:hypothetical protein SAMN04489832_5502 [Micromonospora cremea]